VTLASPHQGTDAATAGTTLEDTLGGQAFMTALDGAVHHVGEGPSVKGTSVHQMSEVSRFLAHLNDRPLPAGVRVTSIGAQSDYIVPAGHTRLRGAHHVVVPELGKNAHGTLPGSTEAHREIALALDGRPPSCQSLPDMLLDTAVSESISWWEDFAGAGLSAVAAYKTGSSPVSPDDPGGEE
jgi:hypothetical protein